MPEDQQPTPADVTPPAAGSTEPFPFPIVGVGASAGGITAFRTFLDHMPPDSGMAFVLIQHLAPDHRSMLAEVMAARTGMPVRQAEHGMAVEPNVVYVIPPDAVLTIEGGHLLLAKPTEPRFRRTPIDAFFLSLAEERGEDAIAVVLAGAGRDGTLGLRAVKECGGLVLAQAPETADDRSAMSGMPRSAIETGLVDHVLPVAEMPAALLAYLRHRGAIDGLEGPEREGGGAAAVRPDAGDPLARICAVLHDATGHDFGQYKRGTVARRIARRMQVLQVDDAARYLERLRREPGEAGRLVQDLLIGVTHFFRDPEAFEALAEKAIPEILAGKAPGGRVRVWVPGCATGEEAYSIAILLREAIDVRAGAPGVQIFATDIDQHALRAARGGEYPPSIAADVSPERLRRYFVAEDGCYRVVKEIREMCVFSAHNLIRDPPFSKLDLISCRNLLIYLNADLQRQLVPLFRYALAPGGYLFLGSSESITQHGDLFDTVDKRHRIFRNRAKEARPALDFPLAARGLRRRGGDLLLPEPRGRHPAAGRDDGEAAARVVLDEFAPAYVVVDGRGHVLRFSSGRTGRYLTPAAGAPTTDLLEMARAGLRLDLRAALHRAIQTGRPQVRDEVRVAINGGTQDVRLTVRPLAPGGEGGDGEDGRYLVVFEDRGPVQGGEDEGPAGGQAAAEGAGEGATIHHLEDELRAMRAHLRATIEELETVNEELQSANEDLLSANEELQSSNEELETSKEELESANEELHTVNAELNFKVDELAGANNDLKNLFESTQIALVFLDRELRVKSFTPAVTRIFNLMDGDIGRPLAHITSRHDDPGLPADLRKVLDHQATVEREVAVPQDGVSFIMRVLPYRTVDNVVEGAIVTFIDITERKRGEAQRARLAAILFASDDAIIGTAPDGTVTAWNAGAERIFGYGEAEALGRSISLLTPPDRAEEDQRLAVTVLAGQRIRQLDTVRLTKDGRPINVSITVSPVEDDHGTVVAVSIVARDVTERKRAEEHHRMMLAELSHRVKNTLALVQVIAAQTLNQHTSLEDFNTIFVERLQSLANVHDLLTRSNWAGAKLDDLVLQELAPYRDRRGHNVAVAGEGVVLRSGAALSLAMVLHELATNAGKYGALSVPTGRIEVRWHRRGRDGDGPWLVLQWTESGGPEVKEPSRRGFGLRFIERCVAYELYGTVELSFAPTGAACTISLPLADNVADPPDNVADPPPG